MSRPIAVQHAELTSLFQSASVGPVLRVPVSLHSSAVPVLCVVFEIEQETGLNPSPLILDN